jgi:hypothetical protein
MSGVKPPTTGITQKDWRTIGLFAALVIGISFYSQRAALALVGVFVAAALIRNAAEIAGWLGVA